MFNNYKQFVKQKSNKKILYIYHIFAIRFIKWLKYITKIMIIIQDTKKKT
jgi:hypothetical protein